MISQREARKLRKRVAELEQRLVDQRYAWTSEWPMGVNIDTIIVQDVEWHIVATARKLKHAVLVLPVERTSDSSKFQLRVYALELPALKDAKP